MQPKNKMIMIDKFLIIPKKVVWDCAFRFLTKSTHSFEMNNIDMRALRRRNNRFVDKSQYGCAHVLPI